MKQTDKFFEYCVSQNYTIVQLCSEQGKSDDYLMLRDWRDWHKLVGDGFVHVYL